MLSPQIIAGARAVAQLGEHFAGLKAVVTQMRQDMGVGDRGYFTPSEDEQVRHVYVSYWKSRNALFDVVFSLADQARRPTDDESQQAFIVAYGAGVLLIDAAQTMRERFGPHPAIVAKLNEPDDNFGIPPDGYDQIQRSLTSPIHAWHLYHANRHLRRRRRPLKALAQEHVELAPVMAVIKRLGKRARIGRGQYLRARLRVRARQFADLMLKSGVGRITYAAQELAGRVVADLYDKPTHHPALPDHVVDQLRRLLQPGDVMITRKEHALTNYFLPGYWPHGMLYLGDAAALTEMGLKDHKHVAPRWERIVSCDDDEPCRVVEAQKDGVHIRSLLSPMKSDAIAVVRPLLDRADIARAVARALSHEGKPYDFDFDFTRADRLVCTEVIYRAYEGVAGVQFTLTRRAGRMTFGAEDLLRMALSRRHFEPVAVYAASHRNEMATQSHAHFLLAATMDGDESSLS